MTVCKSVLLVASVFASAALFAAGRSDYLDLMEAAVDAYTPERRAAYVERIERGGITEHGFARLTSNIGILVANGRKGELRDEFVRMMDLCAREQPIAEKRNGAPRAGHLGIGSEFAVKELVFTIDEVARSGLSPKEKIDAWRSAFAPMIASEIYSKKPRPGDEKANNWTIFGAASEQARLAYGMGGDPAWVEKYVADQLRFFDANGMFRDPGCPMMYDFVTRLQYAVILSLGYGGPSRERLEQIMDVSAEPTIHMQSVTGEMPFGGRSMQFLHNETAYAALCEWYASRFVKRGNAKLASRFRAAADRAVQSVKRNLADRPVHHIKNRYSPDSRYGCEEYAYFDKYMVTMGSWAYLAFRFADESIPISAAVEPDSTFVTGPDFHRVMMNAGGWTLEFDLDGQPGYDATGLGRIQKRGAPTSLALAVPFPVEPHYRLDVTNACPLAIGPKGVTRLEVESAVPGEAVLRYASGTWRTKVVDDGVDMVVEQPGEIVFALPAFEFDGETHPHIDCNGKVLAISYRGWTCRYETDGTLADTGEIFGNRNGHYRLFEAQAKDRLCVHVTIKELVESHFAMSSSERQSDASRMGAESMNPDDALRCVERIGGGDFKVLIYGNSIALHAPEKDFAHLVVVGLEKRLGKKADFRIRNLATIECNFATNIATVAEIAADAGWEPDYVVVAIGENVPDIDRSDAAAYRKFLADIARPFVEGRAKVVLRSPFWMNAAKAECTANAAADVGAVYVDAGPIGSGNLGMKCLADMIIGGFNAATANPVDGVVVRFAGRALKVERCRVSAVPFNRVWPGCQRSMDQTRLSSFVGFDVPEGGGTLEVDFGENAPESARIRPFSRSQPVRKGSVWSVRIDRPEQFVVEFDGGGELHVFADPPWHDVADGSNVMRFGPGEHYPGAIIPKSGTTIVIERGATVYGNLVLAGVDDVTVVGHGILDGSRRPRVDFDYAGSRHLAEVGDKLKGDQVFSGRIDEWGTAPVFAMKCRNLKIDGITFRDAPRWTMNISHCEGVDIRNVKLIGMWRYNSDGIDICSSCDAVVADSFVRSFDDCVIARPPFRNMLVTNCVLWCDWGQNMKIQHAQLPSVMENLVFSDIKAIEVCALLASVTTRYGSTNCVIRNVSYRNIEVDAPPSRLGSMFQGNDAWRHDGRISESLSLLNVYAYALGIPTPNQGTPIPVDEDSLRFLYENIEMSGVDVYSAPGCRVDEVAPYTVQCSVRTCAKNFTVRNVLLSGMPKCTKLVKESPKGTIVDCSLEHRKTPQER